MLTKPLHEVTEGDLDALGANAIPEGLRLEFKRQLDLTTRKQRVDVAADVAAMANTEGGRIAFGVDEVKLPDDTVVAGPIKALTDAKAVSALPDILHSVIDPPPRFDLVQVPVSGGFVLVVEVYRSWADLHMVSGYAQGRYYRRGPKGNVLMGQSEVREAYARILKTKADLDAREAQLTAPELTIRNGTDESVIVTPLYGHATLIDPRHLRALVDELQTQVLRGIDSGELSGNLKLEGDGYRSVVPWDAKPEKAILYLAILKNGVIHASYDQALRRDAEAAEGAPYDYSSFQAMFRILRALAVARFVFTRVGYGGPARLRYVLRSALPFYLDRNPSGLYVRGPATAAAGEYPTGPVDADLAQGSLQPLAKELLDPIFHVFGQPVAPWFGLDGLLNDEHRKGLPPALLKLI